MTLEETILELTSRTPSGGRCRIGEDSFSVWYCSDIWEWEYHGVTYFDALDLAEAMMQEHPVAVGPVSIPGGDPSGGKQGRPKAPVARSTKAPAKVRKASHPGSRGQSRGWAGAPVASSIRHLRSGPGGTRRTPCGDPCPCATPCARAPSRSTALV